MYVVKDKENLFLKLGRDYFTDKHIPDKQMSFAISYCYCIYTNKTAFLLFLKLKRMLVVQVAKKYG